MRACLRLAPYGFPLDGREPVLTPWILLSLLWLSCAAALWRRLRLRVDEAFMGAGLVVSFEIVAAALILGSAGRLSGPAARAITVALLAAHTALAFTGRLPRKHLGSRFAAPIPILLAGAAVLAVLGFRLLLALSLPIESWDALTYHVPMILRWLQQGNLDLWGWMGPQRYNPWNGELIPAWMALLDHGSLSSVRAAQALPLFWLAAAGAVLGRRLGGQLWGPATAVALLGIPIALIQAGMPYVDVIYAFFWVACATEALCWDRGGRRVHLALSGLAFGLALGTKETIYFQAPLLLPIALTAALRPRRRRSLIVGLPAAAALALAAGAYIYARNWIQNGDPIFPFTFKLSGRVLFQGIMEPGDLLVTVEKWFVPSRMGWLAYPFLETMKGAVGYSSENGFGAVFAAGWLLFPLALARAAWRRDWGALGFLSLLPACALFFVTLHPTREPRYVVFLPAVPIAGLAYLFSGVHGLARRLAFLAWATGVCWSLIGVLGYFGSDAPSLFAWKQLSAQGHLDPYAYYKEKYGSLGHLWESLNPQLRQGDVVCVNYGELILPLAGLPPRARLFELGHSQNDFPDSLWGQSDDAWLSQLDSVKANYLVVWSPAWYDTGVGDDERRSIAKFPSRFKLLGRWEGSAMGTAEYYAVLPPAPSPAPPPAQPPIPG
jgi:hypothetical protein